MVEDVCALSAPVETGFPDLSDLLHQRQHSRAARWRARAIGRQQCRPAAPLAVVNRRQHTSAAPTCSSPRPVRTVRTRASPTLPSHSPTSANPIRRALIRAMYLRCAGAATSVPATVRAKEPKPNAPAPSEPQLAQRRPAVPRWAVAMLAVIVLSAAGLWIWSMRSSLAGDATLSSISWPRRVMPWANSASTFLGNRQRRRRSRQQHQSSGTLRGWAGRSGLCRLMFLDSSVADRIVARNLVTDPTPRAPAHAGPGRAAIECRLVRTQCGRNRARDRGAHDLLTQGCGRGPRRCSCTRRSPRT